MAKLTGLLTVFVIILLLVAVPVGAFSLSDIAKFFLKPFAHSVQTDNLSTSNTSQKELVKQIEETKPILQQYDNELKQEDLLFNNEDLLNQTFIVNGTKELTLLDGTATACQEYGGWYDCDAVTYRSLLNSSLMWQNIRMNHNPLSLDEHERGQLFRMCYGIVYPFFASSVDKFYSHVEEYYPILHYNMLLCLQGYPVYQTKLKEQVANFSSSYYDESKTLFSINQILPNVYTKEQLIKILGQAKFDSYYPPNSAKIYPLYGGFMNVQDEIVPEIENGLISPTLRPQPQMVETAEQPVIIQSAQSEVFPSTFDFPKIKKNKQDIYDSFNYNSIVQKVLKDYNKIGVDVEGEGYTFHITDGRVSNITNGMDSNSNIRIYTNWEELKKLITLRQEGNTAAAIPTLLGMNIQPSTAKFKVLKNIKQ